MRTALLWLSLSTCALAQGLFPPEGFEAMDRPNDGGGGIVLTWKKSLSEGPDVLYRLSASEAVGGPWVVVREAEAPKWLTQADAPHIFGILSKTMEWRILEMDALPGAEGVEPTPLEDGKEYYFRLEMVSGATVLAAGTGVATPQKNLWNFSKTNIFVFAIVFCGSVMAFIRHARKDPNLFVRRIPGLDAVDEAIGRATEMGKPVLYLNGLLGMDSISTIASTSILGRLARRIAQYDSQILVPCYDPVVLPVCQEVVREAYIDAGRPDAYREESIFFLTNDQFSYVAAVDGIMMREKPAANLYMGYYYAESLLLAETGAATGAIQIAGTDSVTQLPFFIATCDYTLIGEELYAASAYLSREPLQLGSLKGQDLGKAFLIGVLVVGSVLTTFGITILRDLLKAY